MTRRTLDQARHEFGLNLERNVFIIMRYGRHEKYSELKRVLKDTLEQYDLRPALAEDYSYDPELWSNVKFYMDNSASAIVIFDNIDGTDLHNPNVALELGYMLAQGKRCLILKEQRLATLPSDVVSHLYKPFDPFHIQESVGAAIEKWIQELRFTPYESLCGDRTAVQIARTQKIITEYERIVNSGQKTNILLAGLLSSFAVSVETPSRLGITSELLNLYTRERHLLLELLRTGSTISCIIAPSVYVQRLRDDPRLLDEAGLYYLPRYNALIEFLSDHLENDNLRMVWSEQLPRQSLICCGDDIAFVGTRTTHDGQTRTTILYDRVLIHHEITEFDYAFNDTVEQYRWIKRNQPAPPRIWKALKESVIKETKAARERLTRTIADLGQSG